MLSNNLEMKKLPATCPFCNNHLETGIIFTFGSPGLIFVPKLSPTYSLKSINRIAKEMDGIVLDGPYPSRISETRLNACFCRNCRVVMCLPANKVP